MINQNRWIGTLPKINTGSNEKINQLDHDKWINTISKKKKTFVHDLQNLDMPSETIMLFFILMNLNKNS